MRDLLLAKLALRTLGRNPRRTLLSIVGIGVGCGIVLYMVAFTRGSSEMRIRAISESGFGHARIAPATWEKTRDSDLRLVDWKRDLDIAGSMAEVEFAAPHSRTTALLAFGTCVTGVEMVGVDPNVERNISRLVRVLSEGRYLERGDEGAVVIGTAIADRLEVELDDDLFITIAGAGGEMKYAMLRIVGIVSTGSRTIDGTICHVTLAEMEHLTGYLGAGEITIVFRDPSNIDALTVRLQERLEGTDPVLSWKVVIPSQGGDMGSDTVFMNLLMGVVIVVAVLGVASAQLTAILERKREFAVLIALGMGGGRIVRLVLIEALAMGVLGAVAGLAMGFPFIYPAATSGYNFAEMMGGDFVTEGVLFDPIIYADMGMWLIPLAFAVALFSTLVAGLYPAWYALRTNPTSALSLREA
jgi:ABC-type lipoprotein release transport system permease subunit